MKKLFVLILFSFFAITGMAQHWAPAGATWYYTEVFFGPGVDYFKFTSEKDTMFHGVTCVKITKRHNPACSDRPAVEYMYENNHKVYFYDSVFSAFQLLYDFTPVVGNTWSIKLKNYGNPGDTDTVFVSVDSIQPVIINGNTLNKFFVTYDFHNEVWPNYIYSGVLIEPIGDLYYMFNFAPSFGFACDGNFATGLRCYDDNEIGHFDTGIASSCDYTSVGIDPHSRNTSLSVTVYPVPAKDLLNLKPENCIPVFYRISDLPGAIIHRGKISGTTIDLNGLPAGFYILEVFDSRNQLLTRQKFLKN